MVSENELTRKNEWKMKDNKDSKQQLVKELVNVFSGFN